MRARLPLRNDFGMASAGPATGGSGQLSRVNSSLLTIVPQRIVYHGADARLLAVVEFHFIAQPFRDGDPAFVLLRIRSKVGHEELALLGRECGQDSTLEPIPYGGHVLPRQAWSKRPVGPVFEAVVRWKTTIEIDGPIAPRQHDANGKGSPAPHCGPTDASRVGLAHPAANGVVVAPPEQQRPQMGAEGSAEHEGDDDMDDVPSVADAYVEKRLPGEHNATEGKHQQSAAEM